MPDQLHSNNPRNKRLIFKDSVILQCNNQKNIAPFPPIPRGYIKKKAIRATWELLSFLSEFLYVSFLEVNDGVSMYYHGEEFCRVLVWGWQFETVYPFFTNELIKMFLCIYKPFYQFILKRKALPLIEIPFQIVTFYREWGKTLFNDSTVTLRYMTELLPSITYNLIYVIEVIHFIIRTFEYTADPPLT